MSPAVFSHGDLRLYLLSLLAESPQHGYGIIQALTERTGGTYTPSAGTIYPRLAKLEDEGLVSKTVEGRTTIYAITDAGRAELAAREGDLAGIESGLADSVRLIASEVRQSVQQAMKTLRADLAAAAHDERAQAKSHTRARPASTPLNGERLTSRERMQRADAAVNGFRVRIRTDMRTHVAHGGALSAESVTALEQALDAAASEFAQALNGGDR
ncbi:PadR family transcriptional regulator [uncultured Microbacterium sp.]|uniref:PadR family transcriptional regulator n=1 Tax=uncultured Microbacterium sp. TaxID=191216 RepID=UPI002601B465|nr:PadR family transcriptional regulator [uncultured Microbacterium sp.]